MKNIRIFFLLGLCLLFFDRGYAQSLLASREDYIQVLESLDVDDIRTTLLSLAPEGFNPKTYWTDRMEWTYQKGGRNSRELNYQARRAYFGLLKDISMGIVEPEEVSPDVKMGGKKFMSPDQLKVLVLASGHQAGPLLKNFIPQSAPYLALKEALRRMNSFCDSNGWAELPALKKDIKLGSRNPAVTLIKTRLRQLGYSINTSDDLFDEQMRNAVIDVQWMLKRKPDGILSAGGKTWKYLNVSCQDRARQIRMDMEKLRWFPKTFGDRYIFINLAMSYFTLVDKRGDQVYAMNFRTINGRPARKSPTMMDKIVQVIINPYWVVPPTIFREDKVEEIRNLHPWEIDQYFESHNYEVWNSSFTRKLVPSSIDWWRLNPDDDEKIYIRQRPNYMNALGVLKFMMTNSYSIYLHDTNQRELFTEAQRQLSSGCVRVERPLDLAEYLLQGTAWTRELIQQTMAKPGEVLDRETKINLKNSIPVYMVHLTSQLSSDGVLRFVEDTYDQHARLQELGVW